MLFNPKLFLFLRIETFIRKTTSHPEVICNNFHKFWVRNYFFFGMHDLVIPISVNYYDVFLFSLRMRTPVSINLYS